MRLRQIAVAAWYYVIQIKTETAKGSKFNEVISNNRLRGRFEQRSELLMHYLRFAVEPRDDQRLLNETVSKWPQQSRDRLDRPEYVQILYWAKDFLDGYLATADNNHNIYRALEQVVR